MRACTNRNILAFICVLSALSISTARAEDRPSPEYVGWKNFKVGSWVVLKSEDDVNGAKTIREDRQELLEKAENWRYRIEYKVTTTKPDGVPVVDKPTQRFIYMAGATEPGVEKTAGDEELKIGDRTLKCHWEESRMKLDVGSMVIKVWRCPDVPGGTVKVDHVSTTKMGDTERHEKRTIILVDFKAAE